MQKLIKRVLKKLFYTRAFMKCPRGWDLPHNLSRFLVNWKCEVIIDVGANVGQSAIEFAGRYSPQVIHCFEPFPRTYEELMKNTTRFPNIHCYALALGAERGTIVANESECSTNNSIEKCSSGTTECVKIEVTTLDSVMEKLHLQSVSFLKIDTEGHDLEVLKGATQSLKSQRIDIIQVEAGMNPANKWHVPFEALKSFLEERDYLLFGIYEQTGEFMTGHPVMRRANCVFISTLVNEINRK